MAGSKPAGAQDASGKAQREPEPEEAPAAEVAGTEELEKLRRQLAEAEQVAEDALEAKQAAIELGATRDEQAEEERARRTALEAKLKELEDAVAQEPTLAEAPSNDRLADVLEMLAERLGSQGVEMATFREGETPDQVLASLEGRVSVGDHSGRFTPGKVKVTFLSRGSNLRVVRKARIRYTDARGELVVTEGVHCPFEPDGRFETDDQDVVDYLRGRPGYNSEFWEMGHDPHAAPDPQPVLDSIMDAMLELDDARLAKIEEDEQAGSKREVVLNTVAAARRKVQGIEPGDSDVAPGEVVA